MKIDLSNKIQKKMEEMQILVCRRGLCGGIRRRSRLQAVSAPPVILRPVRRLVEGSQLRYAIADCL